jgi:hypothetical protein
VRIGVFTLHGDVMVVHANVCDKSGGVDLRQNVGRIALGSGELLTDTGAIVVMDEKAQNHVMKVVRF